MKSSTHKITTAGIAALLIANTAFGQTESVKTAQWWDAFLTLPNQD
ncbi:MAG: hypothetical protein M0D57_08780 [Sphingobacteriales bacterium JAD_PAG50586_3]|nr:MAG: hypothetical protein M0D57_08780 [Sphingobacteriales bacterium JAD_PAG50586_3]